MKKIIIMKGLVPKIWIFTIIIAFLSLENVNSQRAINDSLLFYLGLAAKQNPTVLQKFSEYEASLQKIPQAGSLQDPDFTLGIFTSPMELVEGKQVADIKLMQMFPWFGTLKAAKDEMSLMAKARYESFRDAKFQVYYDVQTTYYDLYKTSHELGISEKNIQLLKTIERLALVRFRTAPTGNSGTSSSPMNTGSQSSTRVSSGSAGSMDGGMNGGPVSVPSTGMTTASVSGNSMGTSSTGTGLADLYRIEIEIGDLENNIALLKNQYNTIAAKFNSYLNRPVKSPVFIADSLYPDTLEVPLDKISDSILLNSPMLGMLNYEKQSLDARKRMVTRMGYPMLGIGVEYSLIKPAEMSTSPMNGKDMIMPMAQVTLPIYRKKYRAMKNEVDLSKTAVEYNYTATANSLQTDYYQAVQLYQDAFRRMELYAAQYSLAKKTLDIMIKSFSASGSSLTDILRVRQQTLDYELKQIEALADYNSAVALLNRLMAFVQY